MGKETVNSYNRDAEITAQLHSTLTPLRIYELIDQYFIKGGKTADIGCVIGRDTLWLNQYGPINFTRRTALVLGYVSRHHVRDRHN